MNTAHEWPKGQTLVRDGMPVSAISIQGRRSWDINKQRMGMTMYLSQTISSPRFTCRLHLDHISLKLTLHWSLLIHIFLLQQGGAPMTQESVLRKLTAILCADVKPMFDSRR